jgi:hypothetical protein
MAIVDTLPLELAAPFRELSRDIRDASQELGQQDGRFLIDLYYMVQDERMRAQAQVRACSQDGESNRLLGWAFSTMQVFENVLKSALGRFAASYRVGQWMQAQCGIGPVLSAAMLAHLDIRKAPAAGHFWSFAGLSPHIVWEKGKKRPYNAKLKAIAAFRMGECFVRTSGNAASVYGKVYAESKERLIVRNGAGELADHARREIERCEASKALLKKMKQKPRWKDWEAGKLCPQHLHDWARRVAVKLFLSHLHQVMFEDYHGRKAPEPYVFRSNGEDHVHLIRPPLWPGKYDGKPLAELLE